MLARADPRQHQRLRRPEHAARQHHCAARTDRLRPPRVAQPHTHRAAIFDQHLFDMRAGFDMEPSRRHLRFDIGACGRPALAAALRHLIKPYAFELRAVEILVAWELE